jgi:putative transposase
LESERYSTNLIDLCLSAVRHLGRNIKRWQGGDRVARWTATGRLEAEKKFRNVRGYRELAALYRKLIPWVVSARQCPARNKRTK